MSLFKAIRYEALNARQKEIYNFQKLAGRLADYGYNCILLSDDWQGADFLACHLDGETVLRVQLKGRMTLDKKYLGKGIYIAFPQREAFFVYPHDVLLDTVRVSGAMREESATWINKGIRHWPSPPKWATKFLAEYKV